jgi:hypothetical protein
MTIWILSAGSAGSALAGPEQARQQVAQIQMRLQKNPDLRKQRDQRRRQ